MKKIKWEDLILPSFWILFFIIFSQKENENKNIITVHKTEFAQPKSTSALGTYIHIVK